MDQGISQEEFLNDQVKNESIDEQHEAISRASDKIENNDIEENKTLNENQSNEETVSGPQPLNYSESQMQWMNRQVSNLERELLLNGSKYVNNNSVSNWTKVILTALAVMLPGIGQIIGIIVGLVFVSNDIDTDKRSFGAALLTISVVAFVLSAIFWFILGLTFGPQLYY